MSRPSALRQTLRLPPSASLEVVSVQASGDCFYDCIHELLIRHDACTPSGERREGPLLQLCGNGDGIPSSQSMREYVADSLESEQLDLYKMYASAGLGEFDFATGKSLEELRQFSKRSGKERGPGKCMWADEFALRTVSNGLKLTLLIVDDQAARGGGRKRGRDGQGAPPTDNRFVSMGNYPRAVILHRSRRQHYNAVVVDGQSVVQLDQLPSSVRVLWPSTCKHDETSASAEKPRSKKDRSGSENLEEKEAEKSPDGIDMNTATTSMVEKSESISQSAGLSSPSLPAPAQMLGTFYCGCAGFSSSSWVGNFYPKSIVGHNSDRMLDHYQQHFRTVEINSTFYGIPSEQTVTKWKNIFAKSFQVVMKAPKGLTHEGSELNCSVLSTFLTRMRPLGDTLACILIQCPRTLKVTTAQLEQVKDVLDNEATWYQRRIAFEFRNEATYFDTEVRGFMKRNSFALVMHPDSLGRSTIGTSTSGRGHGDLLNYQPEELSKVAKSGDVTSSFVYLRLHGHNDEHTGCYSIDELQDIAQQIHRWRKQGVEVFCFILNNLEPSSSPKKMSKPWDKWCAMPKNAKQLETLVYNLSNQDVPDAPTKPKKTLLSFFGKKK